VQHKTHLNIIQINIQNTNQPNKPIIKHQTKQIHNHHNHKLITTLHQIHPQNIKQIIIPIKQQPQLTLNKNLNTKIITQQRKQATHPNIVQPQKTTQTKHINHRVHHLLNLNNTTPHIPQQHHNNTNGQQQLININNQNTITHHTLNNTRQPLEHAHILITPIEHEQQTNTTIIDHPNQNKNQHIPNHLNNAQT